MKIDLPSLHSIENEKGGSFIEIRSIIMEGIYLNDISELIYIDIPKIEMVTLKYSFENVHSRIIKSTKCTYLICLDVASTLVDKI